MIMHIIWVTFKKLVQEHIEGKTFTTVFEKQVVAFQVGFVAHAIQNNALATQFFQQF
jgi:hypothetical protein